LSSFPCVPLVIFEIYLSVPHGTAAADPSSIAPLGRCSKQRPQVLT
jgi:hypothetical protein